MGFSGLRARTVVFGSGTVFWLGTVALRQELWFGPLQRQWAGTVVWLVAIICWHDGENWNVYFFERVVFKSYPWTNWLWWHWCGKELDLGTIALVQELQSDSLQWHWDRNRRPIHYRDTGMGAAVWLFTMALGQQLWTVTDALPTMLFILKNKFPCALMLCYYTAFKSSMPRFVISSQAFFFYVLMRLPSTLYFIPFQSNMFLWRYRPKLQMDLQSEFLQ